ncbi:MAG: HEPN domain-containing protein [Candidatus Hydrogenedentes bacterium]|nr:HEPN domain-containing protein [Candidatus Hydrogenedentota bacterium]
MTEEAAELLARARKALETAHAYTAAVADAAASRAYYAAFYAASAWLADRQESYSKHSAVEAAVHRDLVRPGHLPAELGAHYSWLSALRNTDDYGVKQHVSAEEANTATRRAKLIVEAIAGLIDSHA